MVIHACGEEITLLFSVRGDVSEIASTTFEKRRLKVFLNVSKNIQKSMRNGKRALTSYAGISEEANPTF